MMRGRRRVVITGAGVVSELGDSPPQVHSRLLGGEVSGARETLELRGREPGIAGAPPWFEAGRYLGDGNLHPLDRTARLAAAAVALAIEASGLTPEELDEREAGLVLGTMFGGLRTIAGFDQRLLAAGPAYVKPLDFANCVINAAAGQTAIWHRLRGVNATIGGGAAAGIEALGTATRMVAGGRAEVLVAGGAEELCEESRLAFERAGMLAAGSRPEPCSVPFDRRRNGLRLSEGAAFVVLEEEESAIRRGASILAEVLGFGASSDPSRGRDPERSTQAIARAMRSALAEASLEASSIDGVVASANGSPALDASEALAIAAVFGEHDAEVAVTAFKGGLSEALGASGALQVVALLEVFRSGVLPPILGLEEPQPELPGNWVRQPRRGHFARFLVNGRAFDGPASSLLLGAPPSTEPVRRSATRGAA